MLPTFVINLDRRPDRWASMRLLLSRLGIEATRVTAIDGRALEVDRAPIGDFIDLRRLSTGEGACVFSHCKALKLFLDTDAPAALILEDDVDLSSDLPALLDGIEWWPAGANLIKLDAHPTHKRVMMGPRTGETPTGRSLHPLALARAGAGAYLLNRNAAAAVLDACDFPALAIDLVLFDRRRSKIARSLRPLQVVPAMSLHVSDGSDLESWRQADKPRRMRFFRKGRLHPTYLGQKLLVLLLQVTGRVRKYQVLYAEMP